MVIVGRITIVAAILLSILLTWKTLLGIGGEGGFTIQKYTVLSAPAFSPLFILGMFWKRTTGAAAVAGLITGFGLSIVFNNYAPQWFGHDTWLYTAFPNGHGGFEIPFLICMGLSFGFTMLVMIGISLAGPKVNEKGLVLDRAMFKVDSGTLALIVLTFLLLTALYVKFW